MVNWRIRCVIRIKPETRVVIYEMRILNRSKDSCSGRKKAITCEKIKIVAA